VVAVVSVAAATKPQTVGPLGRVWATLPEPSLESVRAFATEMWNRNGYGVTSTTLIREVPWFGIGVGTYHTIAGDYLPGGLPPDNAQNWVRHQLVEFGVLGALGWLVWFVLFAVFVLRSRRTDSQTAWITRGVLIGFGLISMLGMPGQDVIVVITFWAIAFWYATAVGTERSVIAPLPRWAWAGVAIATIVAAVGTTELALTRLRVPVRGLSASWPYSYGLTAPRTEGAEAGYRQASGHAVAVVDAPYRWLSISVRLAQTTDQAVDVRVWTNGETLLKGQLSSAAPLTALVELPDRQPRLLFEAAARPVDSARPFFTRAMDPRFLVKWEFLDRAPGGFNRYSRSISG